MNGVISGWPTEQSAAAEELRGVAEVHLAVPVRRKEGEDTWARWLWRKVKGGRAVVVDHEASETKASFIPIDGPRDLDYESRTDVMYEGALFCEMGCMNRMPRAATGVAVCECYCLE